MELLIGSHAFLGEAGAVAFVWVLVEVIGGSDANINRARIAAAIGVALFFLSWIVGGFYYVEYYGSLVKPLIKEGPQPWAHSIVTETKEHIFLFLPFLSLLTLGFIEYYKSRIGSDRYVRSALIIMSATVVLLAFTMAGLGFLISSGYREAIETIII